MEQLAHPSRRLSLRFTGQASEFFRIWIIGVALSLLTFGIYSAWAKVRTEQYFYRHTWLDGSSFEYVAAPRELLRGRLLFAVLFASLFVVQVLFTPAAIFGLILLLMATPWVVVRSTAFRATASVFRNVAFRFDTPLRSAYRVFFGSYASTLATCGFAYPMARWQRLEFVVSGLAYGSAGFRWATTREDFLSTYLRAGLLLAPAVAVPSLLRMLPELWGWPSRLSTYAFLLLATIYLRASSANLLYGGMRIGPHELCSSQRFGPLLGLYVTNTLAVIASLGLAIPWAKVRLARYRIHCLKLVTHGELDVTAELDPARRRGYGDAAADLGGIGLGIG